jgi:hypothetical protein
LIHADDGFRSFTSAEGTEIYECSKNNPKDSELNHGIAAIGWDKNTNYIVQNSYGTSWGNQGYATLKKGKECGLRKRVYRYNWNTMISITSLLVMINLLVL